MIDLDLADMIAAAPEPIEDDREMERLARLAKPPIGTPAAERPDAPRRKGKDAKG